MASIINASSTGAGGLISTADASGVLQLQSNGTVALTVSGSSATFAGNITANAGGGNTYAQFISGSSTIQIGTNGTSQFIYGTGAVPLTFSVNASEAMRINSSGYLSIGTTATSNLGTSTKFLISSGGFSSLGNFTGSGTGALDTGISINQGAQGGTVLFLASCNFAAGTSTRSAIFFIKFYYDGNNAPSTILIAGDSAVFTFGVSGSNTLTVANAAGGNASYSWFGNK
jgi:hypothetical protein